MTRVTGMTGMTRTSGMYTCMKAKVWVLFNNV